VLAHKPKESSRTFIYAVLFHIIVYSQQRLKEHGSIDTTLLVGVVILNLWFLHGTPRFCSVFLQIPLSSIACTSKFKKFVSQ
jgi:hypothetical protein